VKFTEWTDDGVLRHPVFVGQRDDIDPRSVRRERQRALRMPAVPPTPPVVPGGIGLGAAAEPSRWRRGARSRRRTAASAPCGSPTGRRWPPGRAIGHLQSTRRSASSSSNSTRSSGPAGTAPVVLPDGSRLDVTNLAKVFWPERALTKGDLLRYYARVSPLLLPNVADRPLVMKRLPNGVAGKSFYQQRAPDDVPPGVRVEVAAAEAEGETPRLVGGTLLTLLYMTQLAAISQDPWFSRVGEPGVAREAALDLDPMPGVTFEQVVDVARWMHDELETLGVPAVAKTSGASGLHVYLPLAPATPYQAGQLFCQLVATLVATKHPKQATVERTVSRRGRTVYVDYLQNIEGKTLATAYSARGSAFAGVSTPLAWDEVTRGLRPEDFTIETAPARFAERGDLWAPLHGRHRLDLRAALERAQGRLL
jgi:bifunctional non-homologous end joining protein LigD